jgi:hypothetical protein
MSNTCVHCAVHELLEPFIDPDDADIANVACKVAEVLADLINMAPPDERGLFLADVICTLGYMVIQKGDDREPAVAPPPPPPRSKPRLVS